MFLRNTEPKQHQKASFILSTLGWLLKSKYTLASNPEIATAAPWSHWATSHSLALTLGRAQCFSIDSECEKESRRESSIRTYFWRMFLEHAMFKACFKILIETSRTLESTAGVTVDFRQSSFLLLHQRLMMSIWCISAQIHFSVGQKLYREG